MRLALVEKVSGFLRSGSAFGSPGSAGDFRCRALDIALGVLIAAVPLAFSPLAPVALKGAILGVLTPLIAFLWLWGGCGRPFRPLPKLVAPLLALLVVSELSLLQAGNLYFGFQRVAFLLVLFLVYLVVAYTCSRPENQARLVRYLVLTLLAVSAMSLYGCTMGNCLASLSAADTVFRLFGNTNWAAAYLLTIVPFSVALYLNTPRQWERALWGTTLFLSMAVLTLSMSRGAWVSVWIGLWVLVTVFYHGERSPGTLRGAPRLPQVATLLLLGAAVLLAVALWPFCLAGSPSFGDRVMSTFDPGTESLQLRLAMWKGTLRLIWDHLWTGVGAGNFALAFVPYRSAPMYRNPAMQLEHPHNEYLNLWAELGPLGLLAFVWLVVRVLRISWHLVKCPQPRRGVVAGILGGLVASAAYANLFYVFLVPASAMNLAIFLGMLDGMDREAGHEERGQPIRLTYLLPGLLIMGLVSFQYFLRPLGGEIHHFLAEKDFQAKRMEAGLTHLDRSLAWNPQSPAVRYRRAAVLFLMRRYPESIWEAEEALRVHPKYEVAYGIMGSAYIHLGEKARAKEIFQHALDLNPNYPHALNNLGALIAREGQITEAEALFLRAKEVMGDREMSPYANLGNIYELNGRIRDALQMYETAVAIKPQYGSNWYTVARLRVLSGDPAGAYTPLARAIALDGRWRARATKDETFKTLRTGDPRVRILLRLE